MANALHRGQLNNQEPFSGIGGWLHGWEAGQIQGQPTLPGRPTLPGSEASPESAGAGASDTGTSGSVGRQGQAAAAGGPSSGTGWVNLQQYNQANPGATTGIAEQLTGNAGELDRFIQGAAQTQRSQNEQQALEAARATATAAGQDPNSVYLNLSGEAAPTAPVEVSQPVASSPPSGTSSPYVADSGGSSKQADVAESNAAANRYNQQLAGWLAQQTQTPEAATEMSPADAATWQAQVDAVSLPEQRVSALDTLLGNQQGYTAGAGLLDAYLLGNDPEAQRRLSDYRARYSNLAGLIQQGAGPTPTTVVAPGSLPIVIPPFTEGDDTITIGPYEDPNRRNTGTSTGPGVSGGTTAPGTG